MEDKEKTKKEAAVVVLEKFKQVYAGSGPVGSREDHDVVLAAFKRELGEALGVELK